MKFVSKGIQSRQLEEQLLDFLVEEEAEQRPLQGGALRLRGDAALQQPRQLGAEGNSGQLGEKKDELDRFLL